MIACSSPKPSAMPGCLMLSRIGRMSSASLMIMSGPQRNVTSARTAAGLGDGCAAAGAGVVADGGLGTAAVGAASGVLTAGLG